MEKTGTGSVSYPDFALTFTKMGLHKRIYELDGKVLVCACRRDQSCHGDALILEYDKVNAQQADIINNPKRPASGAA